MRKEEKGNSDLEQEQEDIKPEKALAILRKHGMEVTPEQAKLILLFLQQMADIAVAQFLRK
jgi:hypothetical protein